MPTKRAGDVVRRLPGHRNSVFIVEARRVVAIAAESDAVEGPWESPGGRAASSGCATRVPVVEPAETRKRDDLAHLGRLDRPVVRSVLREHEMNAILVVPGLELSEEPSRVSFT
jgi:hypothetical protein